MAFELESPAFGQGEPIPKRFTEDGDDLSPPLVWRGIPAGTREFALICDDPDAPTPKPWVHWVLYRLPAGTVSLPEGVPTDVELTAPLSACQGLNSWSSGQVHGYRGPAPPPGHGVHHYHFRLYALASPLSRAPGLDKEAVLKAIAGHVLAEAEWIGTYER